jgi:hypothetical protein
MARERKCRSPCVGLRGEVSFGSILVVPSTSGVSIKSSGVLEVHGRLAGFVALVLAKKKLIAFSVVLSVFLVCGIRNYSYSVGIST